MDGLFSSAVIGLKKTINGLHFKVSAGRQMLECLPKELIRV